MPLYYHYGLAVVVFCFNHWESASGVILFRDRALCLIPGNRLLRNVRLISLFIYVSE